MMFKRFESKLSRGAEAGAVLEPKDTASEKARKAEAPAANALSQLDVGQQAIVSGLDLPEEVQHHLMHMGFVPEARVTALRRAPAGDPTVYAIDGLEIALRRDTASAIHVRRTGNTVSSKEAGKR